MGANAVTTVPVYVSGEVLTAADMNITNSGIPVFATTVTRDAAFGGAGEKTLAEGQFAYIEATDTTQYYNGTSWLALGGKWGQIVQSVKSNTFSTTSTSFADITDMAVTITPTSASSTVLVLVSSNIGISGNIVATQRLLRDSTVIFAGTAAGTRPIGFAMAAIVEATQSFTSSAVFLDSPATTSATTYKTQMRVNAGTAYVNQNGRDTDGLDPRLASSITAIEILP